MSDDHAWLTVTSWDWLEEPTSHAHAAVCSQNRI